MSIMGDKVQSYVSLVRCCLSEGLSYQAPKKQNLRIPASLKAMSPPVHK